MDIKERVQMQFGANAANYTLSPLHAEGADLALLAAWAEAERPARALDVATGGGHAALAIAPFARELTALDLTPQMLATAEALHRSRGWTALRYVQGDAETMPFAAEAFDWICCRIAAHHFPSPDAFVRESARVLAPGGCFALLDNVAPEQDAADRLYNEIERRRDPSHYRAWKKSEWLRRVELAGLRVEQLAQSRKTFRFDAWCDRMSVPADERARLEADMLNQPEAMRRALGVQTSDGRLVSFEGDYMLLKARKIE